YSQGFIAMPGGFGTLEELFEILTWAQLGFHQKPIGLLNTQGYFDPLLGLLDHALEEQFIRPENLSLLLHEQEPDALLLKMKAYQPPPHRTWIDNPEQL
ncbi:MAG: TIGR00730 family Rossman fold protein, partial [Gammaproteobacteria bacterium]|nr:TIGR00730 family Rossman fold protein [Gammaproteobacteria bacterium]